MSKNAEITFQRVYNLHNNRGFLDLVSITKILYFLKGYIKHYFEVQKPIIITAIKNTSIS